MATATPTRRAIGIVRVSQKKGREGASFVSPEDQRDRIRAACERDGLRLVDVLDELDVSGGKPLDERPGLGPAVRAVEGGKADVIAAADFADESAAMERLSQLRVARDEAGERVERLSGAGTTVTVGAANWDRLNRDEQRALVRATCERVNVAPGRGADRITVELFGQ